MTGSKNSLKFSPDEYARFFLIVAAGACAFLAVKVFDVFFPGPKANGPLYFWLYPSFGAVSIYSFWRAEKVSTLACFALLLLLAYVTLSGMYFDMSPPVERAKLAVFKSRYSACALTAAPIGQNMAVKLCDTADRFAFADGIAYDSSDQITLSPYDRSFAWWKAACGNPLLSRYPLRATGLRDHFYYVRFDFGGVGSSLVKNLCR